MIEAQDLVKRYGSTVAVNDLSFSIRPEAWSTKRRGRPDDRHLDRRFGRPAGAASVPPPSVTCCARSGPSSAPSGRRSGP